METNTRRSETGRSGRPLRALTAALVLATALLAGCDVVQGVLGPPPPTRPAGEPRPAVVVTVGGSAAPTPTIGVAETIPDSTALPRPLPPLPSGAEGSDGTGARPAGQGTGRFSVPPPLPARPVSGSAAGRAAGSAARSASPPPGP